MVEARPLQQITDRQVRYAAPKNFRAMDRLRLEEFVRRRELGEPPLRAWLAIVTDAELGTRDFRGLTAAPPQRIAKSLAAFLERAAPHAMAEAAAAARIEAAAHVGRAMSRITALADGEFGNGKVVVRGRGENRTEVVEIDAAAANVQHAAAKTILEVAGVLTRGGGAGGGGPSVAVQFNNNVGPTPHDTAEQIARNPDAHLTAIDAARKASRPAEPDRAA